MLKDRCKHGYRTCRECEATPLITSPLDLPVEGTISAIAIEGITIPFEPPIAIKIGDDVARLITDRIRDMNFREDQA